MSRQQLEAEEKVFTEVISGSLALTGSRRRRGRRSVGIGGTQNQEYVNTLKANNILTDSITFISGKGTVTINVGPIGTSNVNQGTYSIAIGSNAGLSNQGSYAIAIGTNAGQFSQGEKTLSIGFEAGQCNFGIESIQIGVQAGQINGVPTKGRSIAIGRQAAIGFQDSQCVAIGNFAGYLSQSSNSVAIGELAGVLGQKSFCTSVGPACGFSNQSTNSVGIGNFCGYVNQSSNSVAVGSSSGSYDQASSNVAIGGSAGTFSQGTNSVAIGSEAGTSNQNRNAIAIGYRAAIDNQGTNSIAMGYQSGITAQGQNSVRIGWGGPPHYQSSNCIAIGFAAGLNTQLQNTICIGPNVETFTQNSCYIRPIRTDASPAPAGVLTYNTVTGEILQNTGKTFVIDHPDDKDKLLVHACLEGPEVSVFYKGSDYIENNENEMYIYLPTYVKNIAHNFSIFVTSHSTNGTNYSKVIASSCVNNEKFKIIGHGKFDWIIYGSLKTPFRDVIDKTVEIKGEGPYTYV
jgi:hypothetical protein